MSRSFAAVVAGCFLAAVAGHAQTAAYAAVPKLAIEHYQLPNGMQVILCTDRKAPVVHLNLRVAVGSKHERPGRTGFAHLFEHLMFQGVEPGADFSGAAERIGITGVNGSTHVDYT